MMGSILVSLLNPNLTTSSYKIEITSSLATLEFR